ncbi:DUF1754-domain-containing protein [Mollisia scopiformis]|uniref:DUF1754-domain-containing protein n=1 Tax=Mollisia scopiformis TaxID=149040 RepID=A0A194X5D5_MOLSC|nr:DUF1754-domain-containing protein [Mollisia scopiformis]KUJ15398.1 DUF1754-domain-containing protein [Mollisia scopiformis]
MPSDDYTPVVRGALKLKGSTPSGITKKKKKKTPKPAPESEASTSKQSAFQKALEEEDASTKEDDLRELEERGHDGKTASERAREEMRRKRLHERLQKEGVKTHKERVEELNKYLSNLSEHHDMPRIGPG